MSREQTMVDDLSALNGSVEICESDSDRFDWVLVDTQNDIEFPIWPKEIPQLKNLLEAFQLRVDGNYDVEEATTEESTDK